MKLFLGEVTCTIGGTTQLNLECDLPGICLGTLLNYVSLTECETECETECQVYDEEIRKMHE